MQPSSTLCRVQEAHQRGLAASTALANVRGVANLAAAAWAKEALAAEKREERLTRRKLTAEGAGIGLELPRPDERPISENPDHGFADTGATRG
jgi:hypothetical protein